MSFYSSNQQKLKKYTADRRVEQSNGDKQQAKVYADIAAKQGDLEAADRFAKLGMNIIDKIAQTNVPITNKQGGVAQGTVINHVKSMIEAGTLSKWWEDIKKIPRRELSTKARIVQKDIKTNDTMKELINEKLSELTKDKHNIDISSIVDIMRILVGDDMEIAQELDNAIAKRNRSKTKRIPNKLNQALLFNATHTPFGVKFKSD